MPFPDFWTGASVQYLAHNRSGIGIRCHSIRVPSIFYELNGALDREVKRVLRCVEPVVEDVTAYETSNNFNHRYPERFQLLDIG